MTNYNYILPSSGGGFHFEKADFDDFDASLYPVSNGNNLKYVQILRIPRDNFPEGVEKEPDDYSPISFSIILRAEFDSDDNLVRIFWESYEEISILQEQEQARNNLLNAKNIAKQNLKDGVSELASQIQGGGELSEHDNDNAQDLHRMTINCIADATRLSDLGADATDADKRKVAVGLYLLNADYETNLTRKIISYDGTEKSASNVQELKDILDIEIFASTTLHSETARREKLIDDAENEADAKAVIAPTKEEIKAIVDAKFGEDYETNISELVAML